MIKFLETTKKKALIATTKLAEVSQREPNSWGWPPVCIGIFHEPKRPDKLKK